MYVLYRANLFPAHFNSILKLYNIDKLYYE